MNPYEIQEIRRSKDTSRVAPHGGKLVNLLTNPERSEDLMKISRDLTTIFLNDRQLSDLELLINGSFSPLRGFMTRRVYDSVVGDMRLPDGTLWPMPICLDISGDQAELIKPGQLVALRDHEGFMIATLVAEDIYPIDKRNEAEKVYGTADTSHPGVNYLFNETKTHYVGGTIEALQYPIHFAFRRLRHSPAEIRALYAKLGWRKIVGFQTRNPFHRAQFEMTLRAMDRARSNLLIQPVVGFVKTGDIDTYTRIRCYLKLSEKYPPNMTFLSLLPLSMRMAGPREALLHALIRKNYGCTHFVVGWNHAGPAHETTGEFFYDPESAVKTASAYQEELGIKIVPFEKMVYVIEEDAYMEESRISVDQKTRSLSDDHFSLAVRTGKRIPDWYTIPEVAEVLYKAYPQRHQQGITIFCTGLSGAGKSTIARILYARFLEMGNRPVTLLDGDIVRTNLSNELGFSREHRDINVRRIGFVASEITKNRGIAICAPIAPYRETRKSVRKLIETYGGFVEVHVGTPLEICENRDPKGLYAKARAGIIKGFTGVDDPYEEPDAPEVYIDTTDMSPDEGAQEVLLYLERNGYIK